MVEEIRVSSRRGPVGLKVFVVLLLFGQTRGVTFLQSCCIVLVVFARVSFRNIDILILIRVLRAEHLVEDTSHEQTELVEEGIEVVAKVVVVGFIARKSLLYSPQGVFGGAGHILLAKTCVGFARVRKVWDR